jgi:hypothetical protein
MLMKKTNLCYVLFWEYMDFDRHVRDDRKPTMKKILILDLIFTIFHKIRTNLFKNPYPVRNNMFDRAFK